MTINGEISVGSLIAALSVVVSATALAIGWRKDRELRRRAYADGIRGAAGRVAALLERWPIIVRQSFDSLQPLAIEACGLASNDNGRDAARTLLLKGLYEQRAVASRRIADEHLEGAYVDLYGYDPRIHGLFLGALDRLREIDRQAFALVREVFERGSCEPAPATTAAGVADSLCRDLDELASAYEAATGRVIDGFRAEMLAVILSDDDRILARRVPLRVAAEALPTADLGASVPGSRVGSSANAERDAPGAARGPERGGTR